MLSKKISKLLLFTLPLLFSLPVRSSIIDKGQWAIFIPENEFSSQQLNCEHKNAYLHLAELGKKANDYWQTHKTASELVEIYHELFSLVDASFLIKVIDDILSSDDDLSRVAKASYKNVTGFLKIVLVNSGKESWRLRLHIWNQDGIEDLHNHKWDFFSKVIVGNLSQDVYEMAKSETDMNNTKKYSMREPVSLMPLQLNGDAPCPCRDNYSLNYKELDDFNSHFIHLYKASSTIITAGFSYFMPHQLIHTVTPSRDAVTLVFTSQQAQENSNVFLLDSDNHSLNVQRYAPSVTQEEVRVALLDVKHKLQEKVNG